VNRLVLLAALALAGCASAEAPVQQAARMVGDWRNACISQGMTSPDQQDACITVMAQTQANEQEHQQRTSEALGVMGLALMQQSQSRTVAQPMRQVTTCMPMGYGSSLGGMSCY
jgi:hypothetical protein